MRLWTNANCLLFLSLSFQNAFFTWDHIVQGRRILIFGMILLSNILITLACNSFTFSFSLHFNSKIWDKILKHITSREKWTAAFSSRPLLGNLPISIDLSIVLMGIWFLLRIRTARFIPEVERFVFGMQTAVHIRGIDVNACGLFQILLWDNWWNDDLHQWKEATC